MQRVSIQGFIDVVTVGLQDGQFREIVEQDITVGTLVSGYRAVIVIDEPVQLDQDFLILILILCGKSTRIEAIDRLGYSDRLVHVGLRYTGNIVDGPGIRWHGGLEFFIGGKEKQPVLDQRTAKGSPVGIFVKVADAQVFPLGLIAGPVITGSETIG